MNPYNICTDDNTVMKFVKLSNKATTPMRGSKHAAGIDLFSAERKEISPGGRCVIKTDIAIMIPKGTYARIAPRSSLAVAHGIHVGAGVVDFDYVGNVSVVLFNHSDNSRIREFCRRRICCRYYCVRFCCSGDVALCGGGHCRSFLGACYYG